MDDQHLRAIGRVAVNSSHVDTHLAYVLWRLLVSDQRIGQLVTGKLGFKQRVDLLRAVVATRTPDEEIRTGVMRITARCHAAMQRRDAVIHGAWASVEGSTDLHRFKVGVTPSRGLFLDFAPMSPQEIDAVADELGACASQLLSELLPLVSPWLHEDPPA